jgi:hypothetical protein
MAPKQTAGAEPEVRGRAAWDLRRARDPCVSSRPIATSHEGGAPRARTGFFSSRVPTTWGEKMKNWDEKNEKYNY